MPDQTAGDLRRLAAEVRQEAGRIEQVVLEAENAAVALDREGTTTLERYGAAAVLDSFYTGIEKLFARIAVHFGGLPTGPAWHRTLLQDMALEVRKTRPAIINQAAQLALDDFLSFRHRFRNLYVFDLRTELILQLLQRARLAWDLARPGIESFQEHLEALADSATV